MEEMLKKLLAYLGEQGGVLIIQKTEDVQPPWMVSFEFGKEAEDSDMVGGAAYGAGELEESIRQVVSQCGLDREAQPGTKDPREVL